MVYLYQFYVQIYSHLLILFVDCLHPDSCKKTQTNPTQTHLRLYMDTAQSLTLSKWGGKYFYSLIRVVCTIYARYNQLASKDMSMVDVRLPCPQKREMALPILGLAEFFLNNFEGW